MPLQQPEWLPLVETKQRTEFVLCFIWKEPTGAAPAAAAEPTK